MYCSKCGNHIRENSNFCENCGKKLIDQESNNSFKILGLDFSIRIIGFFLLWFLFHFILLVINWDSGQPAFFWPFEEYSNLYQYDLTEFLVYTVIPFIGLIIWQIFKPSDVQKTNGQKSIENSGYSFAGFWKRFIAYFIDLCILYSIGLVIGFIEYSLIIGDPTMESILSVPTNLQGLLIGWFYFAIMERSEKQGTFGKQILKIKVTGLRGERISFGKASGRYFSKLISFIVLFVGFFMVPFTAKKQGLHDMIANCLVINK